MSTKIFCALLVTVFASAAHAALQSVPKDKLDDYTVSINQAVNKSQLLCDNVSTYYSGTLNDVEVSAFTDFRRSLFSISSVQVDDSGSQPLIVFVGNDDQRLGSRTLVTLTTSADYQTIVSAIVRRQSFESVNYGNLLNTDVRQVWVTKSQSPCRSAFAPKTNLK